MDDRTEKRQQQRKVPGPAELGASGRLGEGQGPGQGPADGPALGAAPQAMAWSPPPPSGRRMAINAPHVPTNGAAVPPGAALSTPHRVLHWLVPPPAPPPRPLSCDRPLLPSPWGVASAERELPRQAGPHP